MKNNNDHQLQPQDAPLKNTDKAFVRVKKDGSPELPQTPEEPRRDEAREEKIRPDRR